MDLIWRAIIDTQTSTDAVCRTQALQMDVFFLFACYL
jgi:hypothetical protein